MRQTPDVGQDDPIQSAFAPIIGLPAWGVQKGQGSMLTLEFGDPHLSVSEPIVASPEASLRVRHLLAKRRVVPHGAWDLWIYCCHWRLSVADEQIAWSEDPDAVLVEAAWVLDGQKLVSVDVGRADGTSRFRFDLGACLETWPCGTDNDEQWELSTPDKQVLIFYADGRHAWEASHQPPGQRT